MYSDKEIRKMKKEALNCPNCSMSGGRVSKEHRNGYVAKFHAACWDEYVLLCECNEKPVDYFEIGFVPK